MSESANNENTLLFDQVTIIGLGLIGSSVARALKENKLCNKIVGCARSEQTLSEGISLKVIDEGERDVARSVRHADLVFLAMPIGATQDILAKIAPQLKAGAIITDAGSVKGSVIEAATAVFGQIPSRFIPGHPIAGSEQSGVQAGRGDLYVNHKVILTPVSHSDPEAVAKVSQMWQRLGAEVLTMDASHHDQVLAATSHLPHLLAYSLVETLAKEDENQEIFRYAAGGFRDFTRIASSDPLMWHDIFLANDRATVAILDRFSEDLAQLKNALLKQDSEYLLGVFTRAKSARDYFTHQLDRTSFYPSKAGTNMQFILNPGKRLGGEIRVPGDKSISHRAIILGALAQGVTEIEGFLEGEDALATLQAFREMGVVIEGPAKGKVKVHGVGMNGLKAPSGPIYLGNSGTSIRLLTGLLSAQNFAVSLMGDDSLSKRPMERVAKPLRQMGAQIGTADGGTPPIVIQPSATINAIHYDMPMASAQVKSAILLAGLFGDGTTSVSEPAPTRDHTERMLRGFGYPVRAENGQIEITGGGALQATAIDVPGDISSAAFFLVGACIAEGSTMLIRHVGVNPTRVGVVEILRLMGADISLQNETEVGGEPVADLRVGASKLRGIKIPEALVPLAIDEFPALFIAAACAEGETVLSGAEELRVKESDRIEAMARGLKQLGVEAQPTPDGIIIQGNPNASVFGGGEIDSFGDHRIAMAFAMASLRASAPIRILNCANVNTSFPNFVELAGQTGLDINFE